MIGVFDSGFGGLTVLRGLLELMPEYDYMYLGDSARSPYGSKSQDVILKYTKEAVDFLFSEGCSLIVVACNTASAKALDELKKEYLPKKYPDKIVWGVLLPVAEEILETINKNDSSEVIGLIGTKATIDSKAYEDAIKKSAPSIEIIARPCPLLVPLAEEGWINKRETKMILRKYLKDLKIKKVNRLILGCTHYPLFKKEISNIMGRKCLLLDSPTIVARRLKNFLSKEISLKERLGKNSTTSFYTTDDPVKFSSLGSVFLGRSVSNVRKISL